MSLAFGLELPARSISALYTPNSNDDAATIHRFIVGTAAFAGGNKLQLLEYNEEDQHGGPGGVECAAVWSHDNEIVKINASPSTTADSMFSVIDRNYTTSGSHVSYGLSIFSLPNLAGDIIPVCAMKSRPITHVAWEPHGERKNVAAISGGLDTVDGAAFKLLLLNLEGCSTSASGSPQEPDVELEITLGDDNFNRVNDLAWDPHNSSSMAIAADRSIVRVDTRGGGKNAQQVIATSAHAGGVLSLDYNVNQMYMLASAGEDGSVRIWDTRKTCTSLSTSATPSPKHNPKKKSPIPGGSPVSAAAPALPLQTFGAGQLSTSHAHWVNMVRFNPHHEQLLLTASADYTAMLWHAPSLIASNANKPAAENADGVVRTMSDFGESVCSSAWSSVSPWVFANLSYNGKVMVDKVPQELVMSILMGQEADDE